MYPAETYDTPEKRFRAYQNHAPAILSDASPIVIRASLCLSDYLDSVTRHPASVTGDVFLETVRDIVPNLLDPFPSCCLAYQHGDEVNLVLIGDGNGRCGMPSQELAAQAAAMATMLFNKKFPVRAARRLNSPKDTDDADQLERLKRAARNFTGEATFTAVAFGVPVQDVPGYLAWRQRVVSDDATKAIWMGLEKTNRADESIYLNVPLMRQRMAADYCVDWDKLPAHATHGHIAWRQLGGALSLNSNIPDFDENPEYLLKRLRMIPVLLREYPLSEVDKAIDMDLKQVKPKDMPTMALRILYIKYSDAASECCAAGAEDATRARWSQVQASRDMYQKELARRGIWV